METARVKPVQTKSEATSVAQSSKPARVAAPVIQTLPLYAGPPTIRLSGGTAGSMQTDVSADVSQTVNAPGSGEPLSPGVQGALESGLGADMSTVRVHTGEQASAAAHTLGARAFTHGSNIFLGAGEHPSNLGLMAHEATHVIQQRGAPAVQMSSATTASDSLEQEARLAAATVQRGGQITVSRQTGSPRIQREEKEGGGLISRFLDRVVQWVKRIPGYDLVTVILGKDPISGKPVERNAVNVIRGLVSLIPGGHDIFENLEKAGTIQRAFEWFNAEIGRLNLTWESIKALIRQFWDEFSIWHPIRSIERIGEIFGPVLERLVNFAVAAGKKLLEFIFEGVLSLAGSLGKQILGIIRKAGDVFSLIVKDPIGFLKNLVQAVKGGFLNFSKNILKHLKNALFEWLFGALQGAGLILPDKFDFKGIISIILQVLGLTYARLREKLVKLIGEPAVTFIEKAFEFLKLIVTQGIAAAWQKVLEFATGLIDTVIGGIRDWAIKTIVGAAITKLVTMFNPVGAIIQGIITIYNTIKFFIERAKQIAAVAEAVFDSINNIARGNIGGAIEYIEKTMARFLPVVIGFLASFIGLGGISGEIKKIIQKIQTVVDNAINKVVNFVVDKAKGLIAKVTGKEKDGDKEKPREAAGTPEGDIDKSAKLGQDPHILRGHIEGDRIVILMASDGFDDLDKKIDRLRKEYVQHFRDIGSEERAEELEGRFGEILKRKIVIISEVKKAPKDKRKQIFSDGLNELSAILSTIGRDFAIPVRYETEESTENIRWQGTGKTLKEALELAFQKTGVPKDNFKITKFGVDRFGKSHPVEYRSPDGAEVSIDLPHKKEGPDVAHVGWQTAGKRGKGGAKRGHIFLDDVPFNR